MDHETGDHALELQRRIDEHAQLVARLFREGASDLAEALEKCGDELKMQCVCCGRSKTCRVHCKLRHCPLCAPGLAARRVEKYDRAVRSMRWPLRVTLTVRNVRRLAGKLVWLLRCFKKLRRTKLWKTCVRGGFVALEITNRGKGWHPHLELIIDAEWLSLTTAPPTRRASKATKARTFKRAAAELRDAWAACIGEGWPSVKTRRCFGSAGNRHATMEAMKYCVKPGDLLKKTTNASEAIYEMKGRRLFFGFGTCFRLKLDEPKRPTPCECGEFGSLMPEFVVEAMRKRETSKWHYTEGPKRAPRTPRDRQLTLAA